MGTADRLNRLEAVVRDLAIAATAGDHEPDPFQRMPCLQAANQRLLTFLREEEEAKGRI
jgi:hypothetical protein